MRNNVLIRSKIAVAVLLGISISAHAARPVAQPDARTIPEDVYLHFDPTTNDSDPDGDDVYLHSIKSPASNGVAIKQGYAVKYTPKENFCGTDSFEYWAGDGTPWPGAGTITVTVTCVNDAPEADDDQANVVEDSSVSIAVLANDSDVDSSVILQPNSVVRLPNHGTAYVSGSNIVYTPTENYCGNDDFDYRVYDSDGASAQATVSVSISCTPDRPTAINDAISVVEDGDSGYFNPTLNDYDVDGDAVYIHSIVTQPQFGVAGKHGSNAKYTPNPNFCGPDFFEYYVADGSPYVSKGRVDINVLCVNDAPKTVTDYLQVSQNGSGQLSPHLNDKDIENNQLNWNGITAHPSNGVVSDNNGLVTYTPNAGFCGRDEFKYSVTDGLASEGSVFVDVLCPADVTGKYLMNAQVNQLKDEHNNLYMMLSTGYYHFVDSNTVKFERFDYFIDPSVSYANSQTQQKHLNVLIDDVQCIKHESDGSTTTDSRCLDTRPHDLTQMCSINDMGLVRKPNGVYKSEQGTYAVDSLGNIIINVGGLQTVWSGVKSDEDRWDTDRIELRETYVTNPTLVNNSNQVFSANSYKGFAYLSDKKAMSNGNVDFKTHFDQGNLYNSASGYTGQEFSNYTGGMVAGPYVWLAHHDPSTTYDSDVDALASKNQYNFKRLGIRHTQNVASGSVASSGYTNSYSSIWFYKLHDATNYSLTQQELNDNAYAHQYDSGFGIDYNKGLMVQSTYVTNEESQIPTLMYENVGHIFHRNELVDPNVQPNAAIRSRHCWSTGDAALTQGHIFTHLGVVTTENGVESLGKLLSLELSANQGGFPIVTVSYAQK